MIYHSLSDAMDDANSRELQKKTDLFESQYNTLKKEFRDYIENTRKNEDLKKKELQSDNAKKMLVFADSLCRMTATVTSNSCDIVKNSNENFQQNIDAMYRQLLSASGLTPIDPAPGEPFDDTYHMAVGLEYGSRYPDDTVFSVIRKGYVRDNVLVRPAEVIISKYPREEIKNKKSGWWSHVTNWVFPARTRFDLIDQQIDQLEHARSETTIRLEGEINQLKEFVTQSLEEKQEFESLAHAQAETIERLEEELEDVKETISQSLMVKQEIEYHLRVQVETIERLEDEIENLKEIVYQSFEQNPDTEGEDSGDQEEQSESNEYSPDSYNQVHDLDFDDQYEE